MNPVEPRFEQMVLDSWKVQVSTVVGAYMMEHAEFTNWVDPVSRDLVTSMRTYVLGHRETSVTRTDAVQFAVPASWWQWFKERHRESWWLRAWMRGHPVRYEVHTVGFEMSVDAGYIWPQAAPALPREFGDAVPVVLDSRAKWSWQDRFADAVKEADRRIAHRRHRRDCSYVLAGMLCTCGAVEFGNRMHRFDCAAHDGEPCNCGGV